MNELTPGNGHDALIARTLAARDRIGLDYVVAAFVGSLSRRALPARSAFGSMMVTRHLVAHPFTPSAYFEGGGCGVCGLRLNPQPKDDSDWVNNYPFQVQHTDLRYACLDLETFPDRAVFSPNAKDREALQALLTALRDLPQTAQLGDLLKAVPRVIKSNKYERMILLETLGYAGILRPVGTLAYSDQFVTDDDANSSQPSHFYKREWAYPVRFWTGADGIDERQAQVLFSTWL